MEKVVKTFTKLKLCRDWGRTGPEDNLPGKIKLRVRRCLRNGVPCCKVGDRVVEVVDLTEQ